MGAIRASYPYSWGSFDFIIMGAYGHSKRHGALKKARSASPTWSVCISNSLGSLQDSGEIHVHESSRFMDTHSKNYRNLQYVCI